MSLSFFSVHVSIVLTFLIALIKQAESVAWRYAQQPTRASRLMAGLGLYLVRIAFKSVVSMVFKLVTLERFCLMTSCFILESSFPIVIGHLLFPPVSSA